MFAKEVYRELYYIAKDSQDALDYAKKYIPVELDSKWFKVLEK